MHKVSRDLQLIALMLFIIISLVPFYIMIVGSLKDNSALFIIPPDILPFGSLTAKNYKFLFETRVDRWFINSIVISTFTTIVTLFVDSCAGYAFAKKNFTGKKIFFVLLLSTMMIPRQILMVPTFIAIKNLSLYDNFLGLILPASAAPFGVFLLKQFIQTLPNDLLESARIDGCTEIQTFAKIILPLSKPAIGALAIFTFVASWNDFMWQLILISSSSRWTMPLAMANLMQERRTLVGYQMAGAAIATVPMIMIFLMFQKYFIKGITVGAVKG